MGRRRQLELRFALEDLSISLFLLCPGAIHAAPSFALLWSNSRSTYNTEHPMSEQKKTRRQMLEEFVAKKPDDPFSRYGLAMECMNGGDTGAADGHFRELLQRNAEYVPAYLMYAQMLSREARAEEARQVLSTGIAAADRKGDQHARSEMETLLAEIS